MLKPVLDSSELLNQKSAHIEQVERKISFYGLLITVHDRNIREDVGVALEIAQILHSFPTRRSSDHRKSVV